MALNASSTAGSPPQDHRPMQQEAFDATGITFGARLQLAIDRPAGCITHASALIGLDPQRLLLVRHPFEHGRAAPIVDGMDLGVRLFTGTRLLMFETSVERVLRAPSWYLQLAWPASMHVARLRGVRRIDVQLAARIECASGRSVEARLMDLSPTGARCRVEDASLGEVGDMVQCVFVLPPGQTESAELRLKSRIRTLRPAVAQVGSTSPPRQCGLEFVEIDRLASLTLQAYVYGSLIGADV